MRVVLLSHELGITRDKFFTQMVLQAAKAADKGLNFFGQLGLLTQTFDPLEVDMKGKQGAVAVLQVRGFFASQFKSQQSVAGVCRQVQ